MSKENSSQEVNVLSQHKYEAAKFYDLVKVI